MVIGDQRGQIKVIKGQGEPRTGKSPKRKEMLRRPGEGLSSKRKVWEAVQYEGTQQEESKKISAGGLVAQKNNIKNMREGSGAGGWQALKSSIVIFLSYLSIFKLYTF